MKKIKNLGMLIFIKKLDRRLNFNGKYKITYALFFCEHCETYVEKPISYKQCMSCGCTTENIYKNQGTHKESKTRLYNIWQHIKSRCLNSNSDAFNNYGGRGIIICPEWANNYTVFRNWAMQNEYADNLEIDRKDNEKGYYSENCQWIPRKENKLKQRRIKLTLELANEIRELDKIKKYTRKELAIKYRIGLRQIYYVINNKQWEYF